MYKKLLWITFICIIPLFTQVAMGQIYIKKDLSKIQYDMTIDEVKSIFGRPDHINFYGGRHGETQQWIYKEGRYKELILYFDNGKLSSYQRFGEK